MAAKNPNKNPNKGFINEMAQQPKLPASKAKKSFTWSGPVTAPDAAKPMATPRRLQNQTAVAAPSSSLGNEIQKVANKRRGLLK